MKLADTLPIVGYADGGRLPVYDGSTLPRCVVCGRAVLRLQAFRASGRQSDRRQRVPLCARDCSR